MAGHRGRTGEITVRVGAGDASIWLHLSRVWLGTGSGQDEVYAVEASRGYRDRLVLKLRGVDDASRAAALRGRRVSVFREDAPALPDGEYYSATLVGMRVVDDEGTELGSVRDVLPTGGVDLLLVASNDTGTGTEDLMVPMARRIVLRVDEQRRVVTVRLPEGLLDLNRKGG